MLSLIRYSLTVCLATAFSFVPKAFASPTYRLIDLGTLGGGFSFAKAINDHGEVTGYSTLPSGQVRAFIWDQAVGMQNLGTAVGGDSYGYDINNSGNVVGKAGGQAFRYANGAMVLLDPAFNGVATDLNEANEAIGYRTTTTGNRTIEWSESNQIFNHYPNSIATPSAINNSAEHVGFEDIGRGYTGYFAESNGGPRSPIFILNLILRDINDRRRIAGAINDDAVVFGMADNYVRSIGRLSPTDSSSIALGINEASVVVGESIGTGGFVYSEQFGLVNLTTALMPEYADWIVVTAEDINNDGWIVGLGRVEGQYEHAIMLIPEEPSGDFNSDGIVNAADLSQWSEEFGLENRTSDANQDGITDGADFLIWQRSLDAMGAASVPEPTAIQCCTFAAITIGTVRSRRIRRPVIA